MSTTRTDVTANGAANDDEIDLGTLVGVIWAGRWRVAGAVFAALLVGLAVALLSPPVYRADALLQIEARRSGLSLPTGMQDLLGGESAQTLAEIEILRSRLVLGQVVDQLALDVSATPRRLPVIGEALSRYELPDPGFAFLAPYAWHAEQITLGELEVPATWIGEEMTLTATGGTGGFDYSVALPDGTTRQGKLRQRLDDPTLGLALRVDVLEGQAGREFIITRMDPRDVIAALRKAFSATETGRQSSILKLEVSGADGEAIKQTLNAITRTYLEQNISRSSAEAQSSLQFIIKQLPSSETAVTVAQDALNAYRQQQQSVDLTYETKALLERATEIERRLSELAIQEEELKRRFTINHPTYQALLQNRDQLNQQLAELRQESGGLPETQKEVFNLTRDLEVAQDVYLQLLSRQQELQVVQASAIGNVRILDGAVTATKPIAPRTSLIMALALVLGLMLGVGAVVLRHVTRHGIHGTADIEKLGIAVFATVGFSAASDKNRDKHGRLSILALTTPTDLVIEALRSLRTALHFGMLDAKTNSVLLTSAAPAAGKSFIAVNLAVIAAQSGQRVCLIDADLRRGYLRRYFGLDRAHPGLAELLAGEKTVAEVAHHGSVEGLDFIPTGQMPPNPAELLMRPAFAQLLESLNSQYDLIMLDAPPTLAVTDPVIMARSAGATIVVVRHMTTMPGELEAVRRTFDAAGAHITGAVLNAYRAVSGSYYGSQYQNYHYSYKSEEK